MDLLLATSNPHKTREFAALIGSDFHLRDLTSVPIAPHIIESGSTFPENAAIKARTVLRLLPGEIVIADDSGLEVNALGGAPGVFSARYAGERADDERNVEKLLSELTRANSPDRGARFVCALVLAKDGKLIFSAEGIIKGAIVSEPRGRNGFGYDPVFVPEGIPRNLR